MDERPTLPQDSAGGFGGSSAGSDPDQLQQRTEDSQ